MANVHQETECKSENKGHIFRGKYEMKFVSFSLDTKQNSN